MDFQFFSGGCNQDGHCSTGGFADIDIQRIRGYACANLFHSASGACFGIQVLNNNAVCLWCGHPAGIIPCSTYNAFAVVFLAFLALIAPFNTSLPFLKLFDFQELFIKEGFIVKLIFLRIFSCFAKFFKIRPQLHLYYSWCLFLYRLQ